MHDGDILVGSINGNNEILIADGATVMLLDAHITSTLSAGITCLGDATIVVANEDEDINEITSERSGYPGIQVAAGYTLTILGPGTLKATGADGFGAGEGQTAGNIIIAGGTVTAKGGQEAAGIGCGLNSHCGNITISNSASVTATKGGSAPYSVGIGYNDVVGKPTCGTITIGDTKYYDSTTQTWTSEELENALKAETFTWPAN